MKQLLYFALAFALGIFLLFIYSCQKDIETTTGEQQVQIFLTDDPVNFDAVHVDIQGVEVLVLADSCSDRDDHDDDGDGDDEEEDDSDDDHGRNAHDDDDEEEERCARWDSLDIRPGIYNLLTLSNGNDTLLASGITVAGEIKKIRITLGLSNSVVVDSVTYPLELYNGMGQVIISIRGDDVNEVSSGNLQLWLDFDAGSSIVRIRDNHFVLKPHISVFVPDLTASIEGHILPQNARALVSAIALGDTLVAFPRDENGYFKIRGIRGNNADIFVNATENNYQDTTITGVVLQAGRVTDIGTIQLRQ